MLKAKVIMTETVVSVSPEATVEDAVGLLLRHHISGLPVIDDQRRLVGIISEFDLLRLLSDIETTGQYVRQYMTTEVQTVAPNDSLIDVADLFLSNPIRRLPVVENGQVVGIISRRDLIRFIRDAPARGQQPARLATSQPINRPGLMHSGWLGGCRQCRLDFALHRSVSLVPNAHSQCLPRRSGIQSPQGPGTCAPDQRLGVSQPPCQCPHRRPIALVTQYQRGIAQQSAPLASPQRRTPKPLSKRLVVQLNSPANCTDSPAPGSNAACCPGSLSVPRANLLAHVAAKQPISQSGRNPSSTGSRNSMVK